MRMALAQIERLSCIMGDQAGDANSWDRIEAALADGSGELEEWRPEMQQRADGQESVVVGHSECYAAVEPSGDEIYLRVHSGQKMEAVTLRVQEARQLFTEGLRMCNNIVNR